MIDWTSCSFYTIRVLVQENFGLKKRECLNVGTVPTYKMHNIGTVPTFKMHNIGTVPMFKMHNVGTPKIYDLYFELEFGLYGKNK